MSRVQQKADFEMDWAKFAQTRSDLGAGFVRVFGYFQQDGAQSIAAIEAAVRNNAAASVVLPAHKIKSEAREFGALALAALAEDIEFQARDCVEWRVDTTSLVEYVVNLRPLLEATIAIIDAASNPLMQRRTAFDAERAA
jgi:histidine phosphotransfer protein HptB